MKLVRREPGVGYLDSWLWLPKTHTSELQVASALTYEGRDRSIIEGWSEEPHHFLVPRNYLPTESLGKLSFPVYDARFSKFPSASFTSRVALDAKDPTKDYQSQGSQALLRVRDGILCLRCGAGKTVVSLHSAAQLGVPILVVVDDKGLARQWLDEIESCLGIPPDEVGQLWGTKKFSWQKPIAVATVQTLASRVSDGRLPPAMTRHFGVILLDEAHVMGAPYFNTAIPPFHGRRWGLSATPTRSDEYDSLLKYTVGPIVYSYLMPELMPEFWFVRLDTRLDFSKKDVFEACHDTNGKFHYGMTFGHLARAHPERTDKIVSVISDALHKGRSALVLSHSREFVESLEGRFPGGGVTHGGVKANDHWDVVKNCNPVISIMKRGKQALDKPELDTIFVCDPFSKEEVLQQVMGRALRPYQGKQRVLVVVFEDRYIDEMSHLCGKIRRKLSRWPAHKGGRIKYRYA